MYDNVRMSKSGRQKVILSTAFLKYISVTRNNLILTFYFHEKIFVEESKYATFVKIQEST